jgi:hypothetical protein
MNHTQQVLNEMRAAADVMSPRSGIRSALEKWLPRLTEAVKADAGATQSVSEPPPPLHGCYDNTVTGRREVWGEGVLQHVYPRERCPSNRPWGRFPDLPR